jgi:biotin operon repressor
MAAKIDILDLLNKQGDLSVKEMVDALHVSKQAIHNALRKLQEKGEVIKFGKAPRTIYRRSSQDLVSEASNEIQLLSYEQDSGLSKFFLLIDPMGKMLHGAEGFEKWCLDRNLPFVKTVDEFLLTNKKYQKYKNENGLISGLNKLKNTKGYDAIYLDELFYLDFYAIERFGKTKLGTLLHFAKQGQNKFLMRQIIEVIFGLVQEMIKKGKYDAVAFVPPTIRREVQIMKYLETHLKVALPRINLLKVSGIIPIPQKSLNTMDARIINSENTFAVSDTGKYKNVLLIDDAVGSGATMNQIAGKLKLKKTAVKVTGLALVGSYKGFDVITDV